ncbi:MAG: PilZ domain-containing protein [Candidatus Cloacimonadota bacterium]|nr:PilZ domain-containing protein [Candidatus Cloacimonadota bacterium]
MKNTKENRRHKRNHLICYLPVFDKVHSQKLGYIIDVSLSGVMLISDSEIAKDKIFSFDIDVSNEMADEKKISFDAKCIWCKPDIKPDSYVSGFVIQPGFTAEQKIVGKLIEECSISQYGFIDD